MEVPDRDAAPATPLSGAIVRMRALGARAGLAVAVLAAAGVVLFQPLLAPWWIYADADATYVASSANLFAGEHTQYLDHPGMPLQALMAATFEVRYRLAQLGGDGAPSRSDYAAARILSLDDSRPYYRGLAATFYVLGAVALFGFVSRFLGGWGWGLAAALLWLAAPGLDQMSIQYRADVPLALVSVIVGYLVARAARTRDAAAYALAAFALGLALSTKIHAVGLVVPFAIALALRPAAPGVLERLRTAAGHAVRSRRALLAGGIVLWLAFAVTFNRARWPLDFTREQEDLAGGAAIVLAGYVGLALLARRMQSRVGRRLFDPFYALLAVALVAGAALPATLFLDDGAQMLVPMANGLSGGGVNEGVDAFTLDPAAFEGWPLRQGLVVFALAAVAAVVGLIRRDPGPLLWFAGAASMGVLAVVRLGATHYFAPAFVLAVPAALWLFRQRGGWCGAAAAAVLVGYVLAPQLGALGGSADAARDAERVQRASERIAARLLPEGGLALTDGYAPLPDVRYVSLVEDFVAVAPEYPGRRFVEDYRPVFERALAEGLRVEHYIGRLAPSIEATGTVTFAIGSYRVRRNLDIPIEAGIGALELLGPAR